MKHMNMMLALLLAVPLMITDAGAADTKIGFVNLQRAVAESTSGKAAMGEFQKEVDKIRTEIEGEQKELLALQEEIERKAVILKEDEKRKLVREFEDKQIDFKRKVEETQADLQAKNQKIVSGLLQKVQQVILKLGTEGGYAGILDSGTPQVLFSDSASDVTDQVIKAFDATNG